jgi:hypothetical protein
MLTPVFSKTRQPVFSGSPGPDIYTDISPGEYKLRKDSKDHFFFEIHLGLRFKDPYQVQMHIIIA